MTATSPTSFPDVIWDIYDGTQQFSGISTYALELHQALNAQDVHPTILSSPANSQMKIFKIGRKIYAPILAFHCAQKATVGSSRWIFHGLSNLNLPILGSVPRQCKLVLTVHDLIPLLGHGLVSRSLELQFRFLFPKVLARADAVIAVSDWTRDCLFEHFPNLTKTKVLVIENGVDHLVRPYKAIPSTRPTVVFVSRYEPYKGFEVLAEIIKEKATDWNFHIVTNQSGYQYIIEKIGAVFRSNKNILVHMGISPEALGKIYESASVIFHPSRYEGFGLPLYEGLSFGKPVVCLRSPIWKNLLDCPLVFQAKSNDKEEFLEQLYLAMQTKSQAFSPEQDFVTRFSLPTWQNAAIHLKKLYNSL